MYTSAAPWLGVAALLAGAFCLVTVILILRRASLAERGRRREAEAIAATLSLATKAPEMSAASRGLARPQIDKRLAA